MPNDLPLLPPKNQHKHLDKTMISLPSDFRHLAHVGPKTPSEIENIRNSDNVIDAVNEISDYIRPSSSNNTLRSMRRERMGLDDAFPAQYHDEEVVRSYENQPTSHQYINVLPARPSRKTYKAPAPPIPPPKELKPRLVQEERDESPPVVFRSISKNSNQLSDPVPPSPKIYTPERIEAPKLNSVIIERPGELGVFSFGLDDCIPVTKNTSPLKTLSPIHRPIAVPKEKVETPILAPASPPENDYMSTIRSTSAQGKQILDDLDNWLDDLDDDDREKLSTISTDESGYPTLALEKDRQFMKHLVEKYELGVEPETIRLRKKKAPAPRLPAAALSSPTYQGVGAIPPFSARPVSMPPNRPPPSYDAPSFDAPNYEPAAGLFNGRALTKQNALDLRSSEEGVSPAMARFLDDKRIKSATMPMSIGRTTVSSGFTDTSTTSSRSNVPSEDAIDVLTRSEEIEEVASEPKASEAPPPVPKPRTKKSISTEPLVEDREKEKIEGEEEKEIDKAIGEEFEVVRVRHETEKIRGANCISPDEKNSDSDSEDRRQEDDEEDSFIITRF